MGYSLKYELQRLTAGEDNDTPSSNEVAGNEEAGGGAGGGWGKQKRTAFIVGMAALGVVLAVGIICAFVFIPGGGGQSEGSAVASGLVDEVTAGPNDTIEADTSAPQIEQANSLYGSDKSNAVPSSSIENDTDVATTGAPGHESTRLPDEPAAKTVGAESTALPVVAPVNSEKVEEKPVESVTAQAAPIVDSGKDEIKNGPSAKKESSEALVTPGSPIEVNPVVADVAKGTADEPVTQLSNSAEKIVPASGDAVKDAKDLEKENGVKDGQVDTKNEAEETKPADSVPHLGPKPVDDSKTEAAEARKPKEVDPTLADLTPKENAINGPKAEAVEASEPKDVDPKLASKEQPEEPKEKNSLPVADQPPL